jgi:hypothetical protein
MTLQQTVTIPADRRLHLDLSLPETFSPGATQVVFTITGIEPDALNPKGEDPLVTMRGMFKSDGHDVDRFLARRHAERVRENWNDERAGEWVNPLLGIAKDSSLTVERFMEMQEEEIDLENEYDKRQRQESEKYRSRSDT